MAKTLLDSNSISTFCQSMSMMYASGIQTDEALHILCDNVEETGALERACKEMHSIVLAGKPLSFAMESTGAFPSHCIDMVSMGERSGRLEEVFRSLSVYYDEEGRLFAKITSSLARPAAFLCVLSVILLFTVIVILPVFSNVYRSISGDLAAESLNAASVSIVIGCIALAVTLVSTIVALAFLIVSKGESGRIKMMKLFEKVPFTRKACYELALSRFTSLLAMHIASGTNADDAMKETLELTDNEELAAKASKAYRSMVDPDNASSLAQAISDFGVFEPVYARMLLVGSRSGGLDEVLDGLSETFFEEAVAGLDDTMDRIEPVLAGFITIVIGVTLISAMLPLIGTMSSIG